MSEKKIIYCDYCFKGLQHYVNPIQRKKTGHFCSTSCHEAYKNGDKLELFLNKLHHTQEIELKRMRSEVHCLHKLIKQRQQEIVNSLVMVE